MSKSSVIALVIVIIVIVAAGVIMTKRGEKTITPQLTEPTVDSTSPSPLVSAKTESSPIASPNVSFTNTGFSPKSLTVKAGTTVTFSNDSNNPMWPASNPHPTHSDLLGFDARQELSKGQTYLFRFDKKGTWGYHNHLNTSETGTVIVQ